MALKARVFARPAPWHSAGIRVIPGRGPRGMKVHLDFGDAVTVQLRRPQAIALINQIADALES